MKRLMYIMIIMVIIICALMVEVNAYENETYKIDIPSTYKEIDFGSIATFEKSEDNSVVIYKYASSGVKKNITTMSKSEIEDLISNLVKEDVTIVTQEKEKLGKEKAIKARVIKDGYADIYITVSDKHIVVIFFFAPTEAELDSTEYMQMKDSFKMKERTTNATVLKVGSVLAIGAGLIFKLKGMGFGFDM